MKKTGVVILILALFLIFPVLAIETTIKQEYKPGETLIAEISGNFIDNIKAEDIQFYSDRIFVPVLYDLAKVGKTYYIYALLPNKERNYSLLIRDAKYTEGGAEKFQDLIFNFSAKGNLSLFSVNPGFVITNKDFSITVQSIKDTEIETRFLNETKKISINEAESNRISFSVSNIKNFTETELVVSAGSMSYAIPAIIFKSEPSGEIKISRELKFQKSFMNLTVLKSQNSRFELSLSNTGQEDIENIKFNISSFKEIIEIRPDKIKKLESGKTAYLNLTVNSDKEATIESEIEAFSGNYSAKILLYVRTISNKTEFIDIAKNNSVVSYSDCASINAFSCESEETCDGETQITIEGLCCIGKCKKESSGGSSFFIIIIIIIILALVGFFLYKKFKLRKKSSSELFREKEKDYEERFKAREIKGALDRV